MKTLAKLFLIAALASSSSVSLADQLLIEKPDVKIFIQQMVNKNHFSEKTLIAYFMAVKPQPQVIENINHPLEKETWTLYKRIFINAPYIKIGAAFRKQFHETLAQTEKRYGVPASIIVATLGVETKYCTHAGNYRVLDTLSNLGFSDQPRARFFRGELEHFLLLTREQNLNPLKVTGSYAGAIGAPQFMPSSYRNYAASFKNKPHVDLINNKQDAIASVANYYLKHGWQTQHPVAVQVTVKGNKYRQLTSSDGTPIAFSSSKLAQYGITPKYETPRGYQVKLIELDGPRGKEIWLTFPNFEVIKRYNSSNLYAMAVFQLSRQILSYKGKKI